MYLLGSHVGMSGKDMMLGSVKTALSYGANTFMLYTGAPQNTRRKKIEELNIPAARELMKENGIETFVVHAPYIINLANTVKPETFQIATDFLAVELERTEAMGSETLVLHPGCRCGRRSRYRADHQRTGYGNETGYESEDCLGDNGRKRK